MKASAETVEERIRRLVSEEFEIVPYDPAWAEAFPREEAHLRACLPADLIRRIEHIGSTAVPGLSARPIVDMLVEVGDLARPRVPLALEPEFFLVRRHSKAP